MKDNRVKTYGCGGIFIVVAVVVLAVCAVVSVPSIKDCKGASTAVFAASSVRQALPDGIDVSTTEESYYYLDIPTNGHDFYTEMQYKENLSYFDGASAWVRREINVTVIISFNKARHADKPIYVMASNIKFSVPSWGSTSYRFRCLQDIQVNIRETYYEELKRQESDLSQVSLSLYCMDASIPLQYESWGELSYEYPGITISEEDHLRPGDDGFGDNSGTGSINERTLWQMLTAWYDGLAAVHKVLLWLCVGVVALGVLSLLARLLFRK